MNIIFFRTLFELIWVTHVQCLGEKPIQFQTNKDIGAHASSQAGTIQRLSSFIAAAAAIVWRRRMRRLQILAFLLSWHFWAKPISWLMSTAAAGTEIKFHNIVCEFRRSDSCNLVLLVTFAQFSWHR